MHGIYVTNSSKSKNGYGIEFQFSIGRKCFFSYDFHIGRSLISTRSTNGFDGLLLVLHSRSKRIQSFGLLPISLRPQLSSLLDAGDFRKGCDQSQGKAKDVEDLTQDHEDERGGPHAGTEDHAGDRHQRQERDQGQSRKNCRPNRNGHVGGRIREKLDQVSVARNSVDNIRTASLDRFRPR